jgi:D-3-phosphoglycerate dehydrogenase
MKIAILDDYQHAIQKLSCFHLLDGQEVMILHETEKDAAMLADKLRDAEILVLTRERTRIHAALLSKLPKLRLISQTGKISGHIDLAACNKYGVAVAEGAGSPVAPAELTWLLIMNVLRQLPAAIEGMKQGQWQVNIGSTVHGKIIGIWGYGKIGKRIAAYARAFGADVLIWGSENARNSAVEDGFNMASSKADFFKRSDVLTLHLRLTEQTSGIVKATDLDLMKPDSALINTARAELIEKGALLTCLKNGRPGFAGLDVYEQEPILDPAFQLLHMPNVICTPHLGYVEQASYELYFSKAFENVMSYVNGQPKNIVNPEVLLPAKPFHRE